MSKNSILPYNPRLKALARELRKNSTLTEVILWLNIKGKAFGHEFHRQIPVDEYIIDFYCHELNLAIEVDGSTHNYNYDNDMQRQKKLESIGIRIIRFSDEDVKKHLNDVLRVIQMTIDEIEKDKKTSPCPPSKGESFKQILTSEILNNA
jgi:very-short-patch-repair endonuclease